MKTTEETLREIIGAGLVDGLGEPRPGELCMEAAICLALGEPHSDEPSCVHEVDREFGIEINDANWSSPAMRAAALLPLALAQLGTAGRDRSRWVKLLAENIIRRVVPLALIIAADSHHRKKKRQELLDAAERCREEGTAEAAEAAGKIAAKSKFNQAASLAALSAACAANAAHAMDEKSIIRSAYASGIASMLAIKDIYFGHHGDEILWVAVECALDAYAKDQS